MVDLKEHDCISDTNCGNGVRWSMTRGDNTGAGAILQNSAKVAAEMADKGLGIALCPHFAVAKKLRTGALVALFPDFDGRKQAFNIVYLGGEPFPRHCRAD
ncbi:transcriptional regulator, LysR family protein (plasmid) [Ketogulonicigenium robustum]|uniref:Transcriptional regulator, LysR family protein n=1 Tax=Ketogulonicigenium robustum TaxID=92947 RepID=A0A1W6P394_9RHOB|nr:transcriptional regulator, LysR family protein [Ketogulonicigenium robustum]